MTVAPKYTCDDTFSGLEYYTEAESTEAAFEFQDVYFNATDVPLRFLAAFPSLSRSLVNIVIDSPVCSIISRAEWCKERGISASAIVAKVEIISSNLSMSGLEIPGISRILRTSTLRT